MAGNKNSLIAKVSWIKQQQEATNPEEYQLGDIDGDKKITVNDLAKLYLHLTDIEKLTGVSLKAADVDKDGIITINDVARMQMVLIGLAEI